MPASPPDSITSLAIERLHALEDTLAEKRMTARMALEVKFFLTARDARGRQHRVLLDVDSLQKAVVHDGEPIMLKRQESADLRHSMYEINIDAWHLGAPKDFEARKRVPSQVAACAETFKAELAGRIAKAAAAGLLKDANGAPLAPEVVKTLELRMEPRPFKAQERLSQHVMWTDVNSMHVNISLQDEQGQNVFSDDSNGLRHRCANALIRQQPAALFATMPNAESYDRLGANPSVPGRKARFMLGPREDHSHILKKMFAGQKLDASGLLMIIPVLLGGRALAQGMTLSAAGIGVARIPGIDHVAKTGLLPHSKKMQTPESARIEDRLYAAETNAAVAMLLTMGPVAETCVALLETGRCEPFRNSEYKPQALPQTPEAAHQLFMESTAMHDLLGEALHAKIAQTHVSRMPTRQRPR
ncbi:MAG: hypothetical protein EBV03_04305 [Proteobacteria bacterium]|nr:hypothetical protein [Pseudomonadota bacterium]